MSVIADLSNVDSLYFGTTEIVGAYIGTTELYKKSSGPYDIDEVVFQRSTSGTETLNLLATGKYEVYCIAGGGGAVSITGGFFAMGVGGGSGSGFVGIINMTQGTYNLTVGSGGTALSTSSQSGVAGSGGNSSIGTLVTAYGGGGGNAGNGSGAAGTAPNITATIISYTVNRAGNSGNRSSAAGGTTGGASVYSTYGKGGNYSQGSSPANGTAGFVKIVYKGA